MFENLVIENLEIEGIFYPNFVIDFAKKGGKIIEKGGFEKMKNTWLPLFMLSEGTGIFRTKLNIEVNEFEVLKSVGKPILNFRLQSFTVPKEKKNGSSTLVTRFKSGTKHGRFDQYEILSSFNSTYILCYVKQSRYSCIAYLEFQYPYHYLDF